MFAVDLCWRAMANDCFKFAEVVVVVTAFLASLVSHFLALLSAATHPPCARVFWTGVEPRNRHANRRLVCGGVRVCLSSTRAAPL